MFSSDVIWTAEFASQKWLYDLTPYMEEKKAEYIQAPIETVTYDGKIWGAPESTDAAFLYYRTDKVETPPATWQEVYRQAKDEGGIVYQGAPYEGLTCDFLELLFAAGGTVLSEDGKKATIDSPESRQGAAVHGRRDQGRRRAEGRHDLHGARVARGLPDRQVRLHAQLAVRLRAQPEGQARQGQVRGHAVPGRSRAAARPASSAATTA